MQGKLSWLRTLCFAANPETIHTCGSSVYGVLESEDSCFNTCAMAEETREFKTDSFVHDYQVKHSQLAKVHENCKSFPPQ